MITASLRSHLLTVDGVTDLTDRIYIDLSPQGAPLPRIVLRLLPGGRREYHSLAATDLVFAEIECTIQAAVIETCHEIYEALREELDLMRGEWDGTTIDCARITPPYNRLNLPQFGDEQGVSSLITNVEVAFRESTVIHS